MKRFLSLALMLVCLFQLISCAVRHQNPTLTGDWARETWLQGGISQNTKLWTRGADRWFLTGAPSLTEIHNREAGFNTAMSTMMVKVPNFTKIRVNGDFQVQLFGTTYGHNSVYVYGPNEGVRNTVVDMRGDTLCVTQIPKAPRAMQNVIIRIGVKNLTHLTQAGCGKIEGVQIQSCGLSITMTPSGLGNVYLSGNMNVRRIDKAGGGSISVFGAMTPHLNILTQGRGVVSLAGNVGISNILHHGNVDINIIGANSDSLRILADGGGKISINGPVCLKAVRASDGVCVFADNVNSSLLAVTTSQRARVGVAGRTNSLIVNAFNMSHFFGRNLCTREAFVRAYDQAHINVASNNKIFASATQTGSVYFFGSPNALSQFVRDNGVVIPMWGPGYATSCLIQPTGEIYPVIGKLKTKRHRAGRSVNRRWGAG
ncbi:MAG: DUF2807 domain-containing protein [Gammaproteobacteria bacterium]|nr:DUF2807 domain-containing protein [Gammaproteobacteria bacterium]